MIINMRKFERQFPQFRSVFKFEQFNRIQIECLPKILNWNDNMVVSAPTSSGKTVIFQLCIIKQAKINELKCLYLAPIKSLCHEKANEWNRKFANKFKIIELTGDINNSEVDNQYFINAHIIIATPQKLDSFSRQHLDLLKTINILLIDQVHMLNFEDRGATVEAVVSRIISLQTSNQFRIVAVSATIPNINQVADWLRAPSNCVCVFGQEYRPSKLNKVVLGFKPTGNPFTFQNMLNSKIMNVIRTYSQGKGTLIFCPTQKGTESACQQIINQVNDRQLIEDDKHLLSLVQASKMISNSNLQMLVSQGVAFHNGSLSAQDRLIIQKLFLQMKIKILCTTSTLSMGVNLPARLVVIKSTKCYRGSVKGYQQYSQIQIDQMSGRAGRPPFDVQGTVVIMTEKSNYNYYLNCVNKLQSLQSHLYTQLTDHINAEISLKSIKCLQDAYHYFKNSFCYIRMKKSPLSYGIKNMSVDEFVEQICRNSVMKLKLYDFITYCEQNQKVVPRLTSINLAKNSVDVESMITVIHDIPNIKREREFIQAICKTQEIKKIRSKLDERKILKMLNQKNQHVIKDAISTAEKKCFVILQAELSGTNIQNWELRKQSKQIQQYFKRFLYCLKYVCQQKKYFWAYFWANNYLKYVQKGFNLMNQTLIMRQIPSINQKIKMLTVKGITSISKVLSNLNSLNSICQKNSSFSEEIFNQINKLQKPLSFQSVIKDQYIQLIIKSNYELNGNLKIVSLCICDKNSQIYIKKAINNNCKQVEILLKRSYGMFYMSVFKQNYIGFDQLYTISVDGEIKQVTKEQFNKENKKQRQKKTLQSNKTKGNQKQSNKRSKSYQSQNHQTEVSILKSRIKDYLVKKHNTPKQQCYSAQSIGSDKQQITNQYLERQEQPISSTIKHSKQLTLPIQYKNRPNITVDQTMKKKQIKLKQPQNKQIKNESRSLDSYEWCRGLPQYQDHEVSHKRYLKIVEQNNDSKKQLKKQIKENDRKIENAKQQEKNNAFNYFYNLF